MCLQSNDNFNSVSTLKSSSVKGGGFTMVELLVTMVLLGLIASLVAPGLESWLASRQASAMRMALANELALLPLKANRSSQKIIINNIAQLNIEDLDASFPLPIVVLANGYCQGGQVIVHQRGAEITMDVMSPYCEVRRREDY
jgi:general secretion pathway protein G